MAGNGAPHARVRWRGLPVRRWPIAPGAAVATMTALDPGADAGFVPPLPILIVLMALVYAGAAALGRRQASRVVLVGALPVAFFLPLTSWVDPLVVLLAAAAFLVAGAIAPVATYAASGTGVYLVALALLGHAAWDAFHYARDMVVTRPYAEFCGVLDLVLGVVVLVLA